MNILVYGAGAVGGYLGARLAQNGHSVTLITREVSANIINESGLRLTENGKSVLVKPHAVTSSAQAFEMGHSVAQYDLILLTVKAYDLRQAVDHLAAFYKNPPAVITFQNGIGVELPVIHQFGAERVIAGALTVPVSRETNNHVVIRHGDRGLALAPTKRGQKIGPWVSLFNQAGIDAEAQKEYESMKWTKAFLNIAGNATAAILNRSPGAIYKVDALFDLEIEMLRETLAVMKALKLKIVNLPGAPATRLSGSIKRAPKLLLKPILTGLVDKGRGEEVPSFHMDLMSGKGKNEVLYHNGAVAKTGEHAGVMTPVNRTLSTVLMQLVRREADWRDYDGNAKRLLQDVRRMEQWLAQRQGS